MNNGSENGQIGQRHVSIKPSLNSKQSVRNNTRAKSGSEDAAAVLSANIANIDYAGVETTSGPASTNGYRIRQQRKRQLPILKSSPVQSERSERALMRRAATEKARKRWQRRKRTEQSSTSGRLIEDMPGLKRKRASSPHVLVDTSIETINALTRGVLESSIRPRTVSGGAPETNWKGENMMLQPAVGYVLIPNH